MTVGLPGEVMWQKILWGENDQSRLGRISCCNEILDWQVAEALRKVDCRLSTKDYAILESLLVDSDRRPLFLRLLRAKLDDATVVLPENVGRDFASLGSRIVFTVRGHSPERAALVHSAVRCSQEPALAVTTFLGLTLLGMKVQQKAPLLRGDGSVGEVCLNHIIGRSETQTSDACPETMDK